MDIMKDMDGPAAELDRPRRGIARRPIGGIYIPLDRNHGRDPAKSCNDLRPADVAGVDDMRHAIQALLSLRTQQAVRVRNDSDSHCFGQACIASRAISDSFSREAPSRACTARPRAIAL